MVDPFFEQRYPFYNHPHYMSKQASQDHCNHQSDKENPIGHFVRNGKKNIHGQKQTPSKNLKKEVFRHFFEKQQHV